MDGMRKFFKYVLVLIFLAGFAGQTIAQPGGKALVVPTTDYSTLDQWYRTIASRVPGFVPAAQVVRGQRFDILLALLDYGIRDSRALVTYDLTVFAPDESVYLDRKALSALDSMINQKFIMMAEGHMWVSFDPPDKSGRYSIVVTVHDKMAGSDYTVKTAIELVDSKPAREFKDDDDFTNWVDNYYKNPTPENAIGAYLYYLGSSFYKDNNAFYPIFGFFTAVFHDNMYLADQVMSRFPELKEAEKSGFIYLFHYLHDKKTDAFLDSLVQATFKNMVADLRSRKLEFISDPLKSPAQLDFLWGSFFGSGRYEHVLGLVKALEQVKSNPLVGEAARWSIKSNCDQHQLVREYCEYILRTEPLTPVAKEELEKILAAR